jgi:hypothetical protein
MEETESIDVAWLAEHYNYEINMLSGTYRNIGKSDDPIIENALIESFCVHARSLQEFFSNKKGGAKEYCGSSFNFIDVLSGRQKPLREMLNQQVSHMCYKGREYCADKKINSSVRRELIEVLSNKSSEFKENLKPDYKDARISSLILEEELRFDQQLLTGVPGSATNAISSTSTFVAPPGNISPLTVPALPVQA